MSALFNLFIIAAALAIPSVALYFKFSAACVRVLIGLSTSLVLSTFPKPTFDALIPVATLASVTALLASLSVVIAPLVTIGIAAVPVKSPASFKTPLVSASASKTFTLELLLPPPVPFATIDEST